MFVLNFTVKKQFLVLNTNVAEIPATSDTVNYFKCEFDFDDTWDGFEKRVYFKNESFNVVKSMLLGPSDSCFIPWEVLAHTGKIVCNVVGLKTANATVTQRLTTNPVKFLVQINESILEPYDQKPLTPTEYEQFRVHFDDVYTATVAAKEAAIEAEQDAEAIAQDVSTYADQAETYRLDSEAYALGSRNGAAVESDDPTYENNSKFFSEQAYLYMGDAVAAKVDAGAAKDAAVNAQIDAETAEYNANISALDAEAYGVGTRNHVAVTSGDVAYHNNAKFFADQAGNSADDAYNSQNTASVAASDSEAYAIGKRNGVDVTSGDPAYHNNALYWKDQAELAAASAVQDVEVNGASVVNNHVASFTVPLVTSTTPKMDGIAAVGSETKWAKGDHVHPSDTTKSDVGHTHTKSDITDFSHTHTKSEITDFPTLATVATSGDYDDLIDKPAIHNVPSGGTKGQVLTKDSSTDYDASWVDPEVTSADIPTKVSQLINDSGFITLADLPIYNGGVS